MEHFLEIIEKIKKNLGQPLPGEAAQLRMTPSFRGELLKGTDGNSSFRDSAVLILLFPSNNQLSIILIKRPVYNGTHSGQISLPGGKYEEIDMSLKNTALRETFEEIGVDISKIEVIGSISPLLIPVSHTKVVPYIGLINETPNFAFSSREVDYAITIPILDFKKSENIRTKTLNISNREITAPYYDIQNEFIWGATAMIISEFTDLY